MLLACALAALVIGMRTAASAPDAGVAKARAPLASAKAAPLAAIVPPAAAVDGGAAADKADPPEKHEKHPPRTGGPEHVTVGLYLHHIPELDLKTNTYVADFYLWFLWKGEINPLNSFEFVNVIGPGDVSKVAAYADESGASQPEELPDGRKYQVLHVQGRFLHPFPVNDFPFDEQDIVIEIEDGKHTNKELVYEIDAKGSGVHPAVRLTGYELASNKVTTRDAHFSSSFGDPRSQGGAETYSHFEFALHVTRPVKGLFVKSFLPIILVLLITFAAFFLHPADIDARLCLTVIALIAAVALQYTSSSELPPTSYLVRLDKVYVLSYGLIMLSTVACVFSNRLAAQNERTAVRIDKYSFGILLFGLAFGIISISFVP